MTRPPLAANQIWHLSLLLAVAVTAILLVLVLRPSARTPVVVPEPLRVLPAGVRAAALGIDLLPGAALTMIFYDAGVADLLRAPLFTARLDGAAAYLIMIAVTAAHTTVTECLTCRTLGKAITGGWMIAQEGGRPPVARRILRSAVKILVLLLPPIVLLGLLNPHLQGVHDLVARTLVVTGAEDGSSEPPGGETEDR